MPTNTTHINLVKPEPTEYYNVAVHNGNMEKIDKAIGELQSRPSGGVQTTGGTMTGKLNIQTNGEALAVKGTNTSYVAFYPNGTDRGGVVGFGESTNNNLFIINENADGNIIFRFEDGSEIDIKTLAALAGGNLATSLYVTSNSDSIASVGIGGANSTTISFNGDELMMVGEIDLNRTTKVLSIRNLFDDGEIVFHDKDGDVKLSELKNPPATPNVTKNYTGDWNNCKTNGYYDGSNVANAPASSTGWFFVEVIAHSQNGEQWVTQTAYEFNNNNTYRRTLSNNVWGPWEIIYTTGNAPYVRDIHVATTAPSGGTAGNVWHQYV